MDMVLDGEWLDKAANAAQAQVLMKVGSRDNFERGVQHLKKGRVQKYVDVVIDDKELGDDRFIQRYIVPAAAMLASSLPITPKFLELNCPRSTPARFVENEGVGIRVVAFKWDELAGGERPELREATILRIDALVEPAG